MRNTVKELDINVESKDEFPDLSQMFTTSQTFESRDNLIHWAKDVGKRCGTTIVISKSDNASRSRKIPRLLLSCKRHRKREEASGKVGMKGELGSCPFQLRGVYIRDSNGKWKLVVHCGRHNHHLNTTLLTQPRERTKTKCRPVECTKKISQSNQSTKRDSSALKHTQPSKSHSVMLSKPKPPQMKKVRLISTRRSLKEISIQHFWECARPFIDDVHNVASDGNCGFRAVAAGLELDNLSGWLAVRKELIVELESFKEEYLKIYGDEEDIERMHSILDCTESPCPPECWFTLPTMGHLVASKYQVIFVCISCTSAQTFVPLRSPPPTHEAKVIAIGHIDRVHFVSIKLKPGCPIPEPVKVWSDCQLAEKWSNLLKGRSEAYKAIVGHQLSKEKEAEDEPIFVDSDCEGGLSDF